MGKRRKFTNEFKLEAVKLVESSGVPMAQVAWVKQFGERADGTRFTPDEQEELIRLRRENTQLKMERDILKKALGIFSKELP